MMKLEKITLKSPDIHLNDLEQSITPVWEFDSGKLYVKGFSPGCKVFLDRLADCVGGEVTPVENEAFFKHKIELNENQAKLALKTLDTFATSRLINIDPKDIRTLSSEIEHSFKITQQQPVTDLTEQDKKLIGRIGVYFDKLKEVLKSGFSDIGKWGQGY